MRGMFTFVFLMFIVVNVNKINMLGGFVLKGGGVRIIRMIKGKF